jgi:two-component system, response regulator PdtaR
MRVLIVEDEILVAMELEETLTEHGFEVVGIAPDSATALRLASTEIDVALVDINLRDGETGIELGERLANEADVAVVFVTANAGLMETGVPGAVGVLPKPASRQAVAGAVSYAAMKRLAPHSPALPAPPRSMRLFA